MILIAFLAVLGLWGAVFFQWFVEPPEPEAKPVECRTEMVSGENGMKRVEICD